MRLPYLAAMSSDAPPTRLHVLLPLSLKGPLDYMSDAPVPAGSFVRVPLGGREATGVVWDTSDSGDPLPAARLKPIAEIMDAPPLPGGLRKFIDWTANYYVQPQGNVLRMAMSARAALRPPPTQTLYVLTDPDCARPTPARKQLIAALTDATPRSVKELAELGGVSVGVVRGMIDAGAFTRLDVARDRPYPEPDPEAPGPGLSASQRGAADALRALVTAEAYQPVLLEGVTGSGKTEVYFEPIAETLKAGRQAVVLLPEIALTNHLLERFEARFAARPVVWHSDVSQIERRRAWRAIARGEAKLVIGARSALYLPYPKLGLIIVDEEHDPSFKQEDGIPYHARDMAVLRASIEAIPVVLASATPSLETLTNVAQGRYQRLHLEERHGTAALPKVAAIDMREQKLESGRWLSPALADEVRATLDRGEQALLFLNRRGYAPLTICRACGSRIECPHCTSWLVEHRYTRELKCHHCGYTTPIPARCPACEKEGSLVPSGPGVERLAQEVTERFPTARQLVMASDTLTGPAKAHQMIAAIEAGEVDVVIGTQLVTKGYHFPQLTLVGVVDADLGLRGGDLRASERTYQQLVQVAGRAGRAELAGRVFIQTYMPEHPVAQALISGDSEAFIERELDVRRRDGMPPFGRLAGIVVSGPIPVRVADTARALAGRIPDWPQVDVLGPAPAPFAMLRGQHRHRLLVKAPRRADIQGFLRAWLDGFKPAAGVRIKVDVDPLSFL